MIGYGLEHVAQNIIRKQSAELADMLRVEVEAFRGGVGSLTMFIDKQPIFLVQYSLSEEQEGWKADVSTYSHGFEVEPQIVNLWIELATVA